MATENDLPDHEDVKKKALVRLAVAGLVTAAALAGLWWLDQGKQAPSKMAAPTPQPAPIRPAQAPEPPPPQAQPMPEAPPVSAPPTAANEATAPKEAPPPPRVSNAPPLPPSTPASPPSRPERTPIQVPPIPQPRIQPAPALPATSASGHFVVQVGVFSSPARAEELVRRLKEKGIRASTETRVHVGPFLNRQEAEKAQAELRRLGIDGVITTAAPTR